MKRALLLLALASCAHAPERMSFDEAEQEQFPPQYRRAALEPQLALYRPEHFLPPLALTAWPGSTGLAGNANCNNPSALCTTAGFKSTSATALTLPSGSTINESGGAMRLSVDNTIDTTVAINASVSIFGNITGSATNSKISTSTSSGSIAFQMPAGAQFDLNGGSGIILDYNSATFPGDIALRNSSGSVAFRINGSGGVTSTHNITAPTFTGSLKLTNVADSATAPTVSSGFGTSPSVASSNGTGAFTINVGTGGTATSGVIGLPTATNGWVCQCTDLTTNSATVFITKQTASSTTTCTVGNFNTSAVAAAWAASDILHCMARGR